MEIVFTFANTNYAIKAERALLDGGLTVQVMPLPPVVKAGCGLCLRLAPQDAKAACRLLQAAQVPYENLYERRVVDGKSEYLNYERA